MGILVKAARRLVRFAASRGGSRFVLGIAALSLTTCMLTLCRADLVPWQVAAVPPNTILVEVDGLQAAAHRAAPRRVVLAPRRRKAAAAPALAVADAPVPPDAGALPDPPAPAVAKPQRHAASHPRVHPAHHAAVHARPAPEKPARPVAARPKAAPHAAVHPPVRKRTAHRHPRHVISTLGLHHTAAESASRPAAALPSAVATAPLNVSASTASVLPSAAAPARNPAAETVTVVGRIVGPVEAGTMADVTDTVYLVDLKTWKAIRGHVDRNGAFAFSDLTPGGLYCIVAWHQTRIVDGVSYVGGGPQTHMAGARLSWHESLRTTQPGLYSLELSTATADKRYYADLLPPVDPTQQAPYRTWRQAILRPLIGQGS